MSSLLVHRPPGRQMHDEDAQGSLFGGDAFLEPQRTTRETRRDDFESRPVERAPSWAPGESEAPPVDPAPSWAPDAIEAFVAPPEHDVAAGDVKVSRAGGAPLAGPTLDDAVSRAWEGLVAGLPAACPVCHAEIEPALTGAVQGHCASCHVTLD